MIVCELDVLIYSLAAAAFKCAIYNCASRSHQFENKTAAGNGSVPAQLKEKRNSEEVPYKRAADLKDDLQRLKFIGQMYSEHRKC